MSEEKKKQESSSIQQQRDDFAVTEEESKEFFKWFKRRTGPNAPVKSFLYFIEWKWVSLIIASVSAFVALNSEEFKDHILVQKYYDVLLALVFTVWFALFIRLVYLFFFARPVYLVDFTTLKPTDEYTMPSSAWFQMLRDFEYFTPESLNFQNKIMLNSCISDHTFYPPRVFAENVNLNMEAAREEADYVLGNVIGDLFACTNTRPEDIDILIVNCSLFCPTPSLSAMIINKFKMREDVLAYNLGGMGCSASLISVDLAKDLLRCHPNKLCLIASTENISQNLYKGNDKSMLLQNTLFRMGGAAILLSNKRSDKYRAKYELEHVVRVHKASDEESYSSVVQMEDAEGNRGVRLSRNLIEVAGKAIENNLTRLGTKILPVREQLKYVWINMVLRKWLNIRSVKRYLPDFKLATKHFCIHAGGRAVIAGIAKSLNLTPQDIMPSRAVLYRYGNTSSSSVWYEFEYIENSRKLKSGELILQLAFGSGFKCNSGVWRRL